MMTFILLQSFIHAEDIVLFLLVVSLIGALIISFLTFIYQIIRKNINPKRLILLFVGSFIGLTALFFALIYLIFGGF